MMDLRISRFCYDPSGCEERASQQRTPPQVQLFEATNRAVDLPDVAHAYAVEWERCAEAAGNPLACETLECQITRLQEHSRLARW
jgi:hypothetical protein